MKNTQPTVPKFIHKQLTRLFGSYRLEVEPFSKVPTPGFTCLVWYGEPLAFASITLRKRNWKITL